MPSTASAASIDKPKLAAATPDGYAELLVWAQSLGEIHAFGVEGCGSYGSGLARFLRRHGHIVHEVARPPRKGERRLSGKSDPIDAEHAARTVLSGSGTATPKLANGQIEAVRVIKIARDTAVKARTAAIITLKAVLVTVSDELRIELESLTDHILIIVCAALETNGNMSDPHVATRYTLAHLAQRWARPSRRDQGPRCSAQSPHKNRSSQNARAVRRWFRYRR